MSYTRSFTKSIAVHYSGTVSYPASQSGGTKSYSGTAYETVTVNVHVDTDPFDHEISSCKSDVGLLTGAVMATEAAQVKSIDSTARQVGQTIINGFFKTVRSEITQQIAELHAKIDATLLHLHELAKRCVAKQQQMSADYHRITSRYSKIFEDLNQELENRIFAIDQPTFMLYRSATGLSAGTNDGDLVTTAAVGNQENASLHSRITASLAKRQALNAIDRANTFLQKQQRVDHILRHCLLTGSRSGMHYMPAAYMEATVSADRTEQSVHASVPLQHMPEGTFDADFKGCSWNNSITQEHIDLIRRHFNTQMSDTLDSSTPHQRRVQDYMTRLFNLSAAKTPSPTPSSKHDK